jgi:hypothetical protein
MIWLCIITACISCLWIALEDFKTREIHIYPFLLLILSGLGYQYLTIKWKAWESFSLNLTILGFIFFSIIFLYRLKGEKQIMDTKMGWGDWIFLLGLASWLEPQFFILFYAISTVGITIIVSCIKLYRAFPENYPIPLAGILGVLFAVFLPVLRLNLFD